MICYQGVKEHIDKMPGGLHICLHVDVLHHTATLHQCLNLPRSNPDLRMVHLDRSLIIESRQLGQHSEGFQGGRQGVEVVKL